MKNKERDPSEVSGREKVERVAAQGDGSATARKITTAIAETVGRRYYCPGRYQCSAAEKVVLLSHMLQEGNHPRQLTSFHCFPPWMNGVWMAFSLPQTPFSWPIVCGKLVADATWVGVEIELGVGGAAFGRD